MNYEVKTETIYAYGDDEYDEQVAAFCADGWEPFASEYQQDHRYIIRLKRKKTEGDFFMEALKESFEKEGRE